VDIFGIGGSYELWKSAMAEFATWLSGSDWKSAMAKLHLG
jgi:hypothetical protein